VARISATAVVAMTAAGGPTVVAIEEGAAGGPTVVTTGAGAAEGAEISRQREGSSSRVGRGGRGGFTGE
jgi:L-serine deaminase